MHKPLTKTKPKQMLVTMSVRLLPILTKGAVQFDVTRECIGVCDLVEVEIDDSHVPVIEMFAKDFTSITNLLKGQRA